MLFRSQEQLKIIQKNKHLGIFSLNFSTNSKRIHFFELKEIGKNRNSGSVDRL